MSRFLSLERFYFAFKEAGIYLLIKTFSGYSFSRELDGFGCFFYSFYEAKNVFI